MAFVLKPRRVQLGGNCHLELEPDGERPGRYLVRFIGLDRDPAARAATQRARVRLMLAHLRGEAPFPSPLPSRVTIGWLDREGWHPGCVHPWPPPSRTWRRFGVPWQSWPMT
jgi:hypothetical protein